MPLTEPPEPGVTAEESSSLGVSHWEEVSVPESVADSSVLVSELEPVEDSVVESVLVSVVESVPVSVDESVVELSVVVFSEAGATSWDCTDSSVCEAVTMAPRPMTATLVAATAALIRREVRRC